MKLRLKFTFALIALMLTLLACKPAKSVRKEAKRAYNEVKEEL
jgi:hypothetical protein